MGVYINMEMPDGCVVCPFFIENHHDRGDDSLCRASGKEAKCGCPLVPAPPHGRLIDADALKDVQQADADLFKGSSDYGGKCRYDEAINAVANIVNAPTIIPAEEGE